MSRVPRIYSSDDPSAPQIAGQPGRLVELLDAILVNGYGSGDDEKEPLGWTQEFTQSNKRVYRNDPVLGTGAYLRVDDQPARFARLAWFSDLDSIDAGQDETPVGGQVIPKSTAENSVARGWWAIGNCKSLYLFINIAGHSWNRGMPYFAGDFVSLVPGDQFSVGISHSPLASYSGSGAASSLFMNGYIISENVSNSISRTSIIAMRGADGSHGNRLLGGLSPLGANIRYGGGGIPYPDPVSGGILVCDLGLNEGANRLRGRMPGLLVPIHNRPLGELSIHPQLNAIAKDFDTYDPNSQTYSGQVLFDLSGDEW